MVVRLRRMLKKPMHPMVTQRHSPLNSKPMPGHPPMVVRLRRMLTKPMHPMVTQRHSPLISKPMPGHPPMVVRPRRMLTDKPLLARNRTMENPPRHASIGTTSTLPRSTQ